MAGHAGNKVADGRRMQDRKVEVLGADLPGEKAGDASATTEVNERWSVKKKGYRTWWENGRMDEADDAGRGRQARQGKGKAHRTVEDPSPQAKAPNDC